MATIPQPTMIDINKILSCFHTNQTQQHISIC